MKHLLNIFALFLIASFAFSGCTGSPQGPSAVADAGVVLGPDGNPVKPWEPATVADPEKPFDQQPPGTRMTFSGSGF